MTKNITVGYSERSFEGWRADAHRTYFTITIADTGASDIQIAEDLFEATNLQVGPLWEMIEPLLPADRNHTSLSVGDEVTIDGTTLSCETIGWKART